MSLTLFLVLGITLAVMPRRADAYIDPGTGGVIGQVLVALLAGAGALITTYRSRIKEFFSRLRQGK